MRSLERISGGKNDEEIRENSNASGNGSSNGSILWSIGKCRG